MFWAFWICCLILILLAVCTVSCFRSENKKTGWALGVVSLAVLAFLVWYLLPFKLPKAESYTADCRIGTQRVVLDAGAASQLAEAVNTVGLKRGVESIAEPMTSGSYVTVLLSKVSEKGEVLLGDLFLRLDQPELSFLRLPGAFSECRPRDGAALLEAVRPILEQAGLNLK